MSKPVNEIFYSLQGEGRWTGRAAAFVRFAGCNLQCRFCDTDFSAKREMTDGEIVDAIQAFPTQYVVLTGGEPALYVDKPLITALHAAGKTIAIETNGTRSLPDGIDWVTLSPKYDAAGRLLPLAINKADELKVVYWGQSVNALEQIEARYRYLQPCDEQSSEKNQKNTAAAINYCLNHPTWMLSTQLHKMIGIK